MAAVTSDRSRAPPGLFVAAVAATAVMPPFRAQSGFARNDGYLEVDYLNWPFDYVMVALAVVAVSATFLFASTRATRSLDGRRSPGSCLRGHRDRRTVLCPARLARGRSGVAVRRQEVRVRADHAPRGGSLRRHRLPRPCLRTPTPLASGADLRCRSRARGRRDIRDLLATRPRVLHDADGRPRAPSRSRRLVGRPRRRSAGLCHRASPVLICGSTSCSRPRSCDRTTCAPCTDSSAAETQD